MDIAEPSFFKTGNKIITTRCYEIYVKVPMQNAKISQKKVANFFWLV